MFVTSKAAKDITPKEAESYILGYTVGNDLSCRYFQLPNNSGGQFYFAKAFDKFAPIGPVLVSPKYFDVDASTKRLTTRVNGKTVQDTVIADDMIFEPAQILSQMSQGLYMFPIKIRSLGALTPTSTGTTIPAGTAVMTGTPAGVGAFQSPKSFLGDGDVVEVELSGVGILRNTIRFEE